MKKTLLLLEGFGAGEMDSAPLGEANWVAGGQNLREIVGTDGAKQRGRSWRVSLRKAPRQVPIHAAPGEGKTGTEG